MRKFTTCSPMRIGLHSSTESRLIEIISSKKDNNGYSSQIFTRYDTTRKFDTSIAPLTVFTELQTNTDPKTKTSEKTTTETSVKVEIKTSDRYSHPNYQITAIPNRVIVRKIPPFIVALAYIPSLILVCLVIPYLLIKCRKFIKIRRLKRRQSRIVRDSGMIEMSSVINEL